VHGEFVEAHPGLVETVDSQRVVLLAESHPGEDVFALGVGQSRTFEIDDCWAAISVQHYVIGA
jgi:hypothetical protein